MLLLRANHTNNVSAIIASSCTIVMAEEEEEDGYFVRIRILSKFFSSLTTTKSISDRDTTSNTATTYIKIMIFLFAIWLIAFVMMAIFQIKPKKKKNHNNKTLPNTEGKMNTNEQNDKDNDEEEENSMRMILLQKMRQRKREFLKRCVQHGYGYRDSSVSATGYSIDTWRAKQFPGLIRPLSETEPKTTNKDGNNDTDDTEEEDDDETNRMVYLDYAGAALPSKFQWEQIAKQQRGNIILGNPHSTGPAAARTIELMERGKTRILDHFHAHPGPLAGNIMTNMNNDEEEMEHCHPGYEIVFTSGATHALQIVAEHFPWHPVASVLVYPQNAHTSVIGMRANAPTFLCKPMEDLIQDIRTCSGDDDDDSTVQDAASSSSSSQQQSLDSLWRRNNETDEKDGTMGDDARNLLVLPVECNFAGNRMSDVASVVKQFRRATRRDKENNHHHDNHWHILLDLAKAASTSPVNLRAWDPDFACVSFYKLFGEPTGLGCLFVKRTVIDTFLQNRHHDEIPSHHSHYFGGGSVDAVLPKQQFAIRRSEPTLLASLNNGTCHFRGIVSLLAGFQEIDRVGGMAAIQQHTCTLTMELVRRFRAMRHRNGRAVVEIYGDWKKHNLVDMSTLPGPIVAFNILREDGTYVGCNEVSKLATLHHPPIQLRTGCFCNPGACQLALNKSDDDVVRNYEESGHVCGDHIDIVDEKPTGAIRASFGKDSIWEDADTLISFLSKMFVNQNYHETTPVLRWDGHPKEVIITELYIFPIKSCAAQKVKKWPLDVSTYRLVLDREFALVDSSGQAMRLQTYLKMLFLKPEINLINKTLTVSAPGCSNLVLSLENSGSNLCSNVINVCGNKRCGTIWGGVEASEWFSSYLGVKCWLARHSKSDDHHSIAKSRSISESERESFANEQPLLLISEHALEVLNDMLRKQKQRQVTSCHFRPNIVVRLHHLPTKCKGIHLEDGWKQLESVGQGTTFQVVGSCARCSMVDFDPQNGTKGKTLRALAEYRRSNGQICFGIFLRGCATKVPNTHVAVGDVLLCT